MSRLGLNQAGRFNSGGTDYFSLADDGDKAVVTFLYDDPEGNDVDFYLVHEIEVEGRRRYVSCKAVHGDKEDPSLCPLCQEKFKRMDKLYLQLYNHDSGKVEVWERGRNFVPKISRMINKFEYLVEQTFEIERIGRKGDTQTTYEIERIEEVLDRDLSEFPEKIDVEGSVILNLTEDEMWDVVDGTYKLPGSDNNSGASNRRQPRERGARGSSSPRTASRDEQPAQRGPRSRGPRTGRDSF